MAQKAFPSSLRNNFETFEGFSFWDEANSNFIKDNIKTLMKRCCISSGIAINAIEIKQYHDNLLINLDLIQFHAHGLKRYVSRRYKENRKKLELDSWQKVAQKLNLAIKLLNLLMPHKKVYLKVRRVKTFSKQIPVEARYKMNFYKRVYNIPKFPYARYGLQLMNLALNGKLSAFALSNFLEHHMRTKQKRKRHNLFLKYIQQGLEALEPFKKSSLCIKIKGRFGKRAKGRSQVWKQNIGFVPFGRLEVPIDVNFKETRTAYGGVGLKVYLYKNNK